jgi:hypothetical protein
MDEKVTLEDVLSQVDSVLETTLCHAQSDFRNTKPDKWDIKNEKLMRDWSLKLMYLAIDDFFRTGLQPNAKPGAYDCSQTKYLMFGAPSIGLGAVLRMYSGPRALLALSINRIPVFFPKNAKGQDEWPFHSTVSPHCQ